MTKMAQLLLNATVLTNTSLSYYVKKMFFFFGKKEKKERRQNKRYLRCVFIDQYLN